MRITSPIKDKYSFNRSYFQYKYSDGTEKPRF